jgi:hypothetical protein
MRDPGRLIEFLIPVTAVIVVLLMLGVSARTTLLLEFLLGATAGLQAVKFGGKVHLSTLVCALYLLIGTRPNQHRAGRSLVLFTAVGFLILSVPLGSMVVRVAPAIQLVALTLTSAVIAVKATKEAIHVMLYGLLTVCTFAAAVAIGQRLGIIPSQLLVTSEFQRPSGIYTEPDWLGLFSAIGLVIAFTTPLRTFVRPVVVAVLSTALLLSFARAAWLALGVVIVAGMLRVLWSLLSGRYRGNRVLHRSVVAVVATAVIAALAMPGTGLVSAVGQRISTAGTASDPSTATRLDQYTGLNQLAAVAPWHGLGLSAAGRVDTSGTIFYGDAASAVGVGPDVVATNWILGWWVDGKYLALPIIAVLIGLALANVRRTSGLLLLLILVSSVFSNAILFPVTWLAVGLALAELPVRSPKLLTSSGNSFRRAGPPALGIPVSPAR